MVGTSLAARSANRLMSAGRAETLLLAALLGSPLAAAAGTWQPLKNQPVLPSIVVNNNVRAGGAAFPLLLTDGGVIVQNNGAAADGTVWKLSPDINGSYLSGTWSQLASMPYVPTDAAQAVLADGRVIIEGGEYTGPSYDLR